MSRARAAIILAAGQGTRMKSALAKVLHPMGGRPLIDWGLALASDLRCERTIVVIAANAEVVAARVRAALGESAIAIQDPPRGTGDAARAAGAALESFAGDVVIFFGDTPLIRAATLERMFAARTGADIIMLGFRPADPTGYGRILRDDAGEFVRNVEHKDATEAERRETLCNAGALVADKSALFQLLAQLRDDNAQREFYLTDVPGLGRAAGLKIAIVEAEDEQEVLGVNSRAQLADAEAAFQQRARAELMAGGVTMIDPASVFLSFDTRIARDVTLEPNVYFGPGVSIAEGARIKAFSHIEGAEIGAGAQIGPFARLRPGAKLGESVKIGNFVEVKNATFGPKAQASHLAYVGDADVGARANLGAGTITCNYDGFAKYRTTIGEDAFIGSDTALVAPVSVGKGAYTGTGSVITRDVPDGALGVARGRQANLEGWADKNRAKKQKPKD
ncbi:MAG: bifunctional UDP-N-acetylglucosamine diphosphorylase/glucosamine-1-phosphate N-acetyltransferase GlmU [Hyphomonadaceae bacterium]